MGNSSRGPGFTLFVQHWEVWIFAIFFTMSTGRVLCSFGGCFLFAFSMFGEANVARYRAEKLPFYLITALLQANPSLDGLMI